MNFSLLRQTLAPPPRELFFTRNDPEDPRLGDVVQRFDAAAGVRPERGEKRALVGILGAPQDEGVRRNKGRLGAKDAPNEIRRALYKLTPFAGEGEDVSALALVDFGDVVMPTGAPSPEEDESWLEAFHSRLESVVAEILGACDMAVIFGGGHDVAYPHYRGMARRYGSRGVVNIDAHLDYRPPVPRRHSGSPFRQALDDAEFALRAENFVEFGAQNFANAAAHFNELRARGARIFTLDEIRRPSAERAVEQGGKQADALFASALGYAIQQGATEALMVSFDMDAARSADAPGVSAPSPVGFSASEMLRFAFLAGAERRTRLVDIVECNPRFDADGRTAKLAALIAAQTLRGILARP
jgi:formimidoylglutamase